MGSDWGTVPLYMLQRNIKHQHANIKRLEVSVVAGVGTFSFRGSGPCQAHFAPGLVQVTRWAKSHAVKDDQRMKRSLRLFSTAVGRNKMKEMNELTELTELNLANLR